MRGEYSNFQGRAWLSRGSDWHRAALKAFGEAQPLLPDFMRPYLLVFDRDVALAQKTLRHHVQIVTQSGCQDPILDN